MNSPDPPDSFPAVDGFLDRVMAADHEACFAIMDSPGPHESFQAVEGFLERVMSTDPKIGFPGAEVIGAVHAFPTVQRFVELCGILADDEGQHEPIDWAKEEAFCGQSDDVESMWSGSTSFGETVSLGERSQKTDDWSSASVCSNDVPSGTHCLVVCDWDDTLLPTTWLGKQGLLGQTTSISAEQRVLLESMAACARKTLEMAKQLGRVVIITNAVSGWVEMSCAMFMPSLSFLLHEMDIVYARSDFGSHAPEHPAEWKRLAFASELNLFHTQLGLEQWHNIICLGDSLHEHEALSSATQGLLKCNAKSLKFMEAPTMMQLIDQHRMLSVSFHEIASHKGDVRMEVSTCQKV